MTSHFVLKIEKYDFSLPVFYSPGFFLMLASLYTMIVFNLNKKKRMKCVQSSLNQWIPVCLSTALFVVMSEMMFSAGMVQTLSGLAAQIFGTGFLFLSPVIGGLGGYLTGSNTGSNAMFMKLQVQTAYQLGFSPDVFAYAQNAGSSHVLTAAVCQMQSAENDLLKKITVNGIGTLLILSLGMFILHSIHP